MLLESLGFRRIGFGESVRKLPFATVFAFCTIGLFIYAPRYDQSLWGWIDYVALFLFMLLLSWLASGSGETATHHEAGDDTALRLGKLCKRTLGRFKRRSITHRSD